MTDNRAVICTDEVQVAAFLLKTLLGVKKKGQFR
jgi:hypothetical protein